MYHPANRGMFLETLINYTINEYRNKNIALFYKRPVDLVPLQKNGAIVEKAYFKEKSTCDYYGVYQGFYIEFEAKETSRQKFNLSSLKEHQLQQLKAVQDHKGISFIIVYFQIFDKFYLLAYEEIKKWLLTMPSKQIPIQYFNEVGLEVKIKYPYLLDFQLHLNHLINCI